MKNLIYIFFLIPITLIAQDWHKEERTYKYDNLNRLVKVVFSNGFSYEYSYDKLGNRLLKKTELNISKDDFTITSQNINGCNSD